MMSVLHKINFWGWGHTIQGPTVNVSFQFGLHIYSGDFMLLRTIKECFWNHLQNQFLSITKKVLLLIFPVSCPG